MTKENDLIFKIAALTHSAHKNGVEIGIGDDTALIDSSAYPRGILATTDMLIDRTHFDTAIHDPELIGRKCLAVNLSDIAAMGGTPLHALLSLAIPTGIGEQWMERFLKGFITLAREYDVTLVGGDTNSSKDLLSVNVTLMGTPHQRQVATRSGAQPGDSIFVTGPLGGSIHGKHFTFTPRIQEATALLDLVRIHAMMDLSDGLALDLRRLCTASNVGATIDQQRIPISAVIPNTLSPDERILHAMGDGEDFELLITMDPKHQHLLDTLPFPLIEIGSITKDPSLLLRTTHGLIDLPKLGYQHSF